MRSFPNETNINDFISKSILSHRIPLHKYSISMILYQNWCKSIQIERFYQKYHIYTYTKPILLYKKACNDIHVGWFPIKKNATSRNSIEIHWFSIEIHERPYNFNDFLSTLMNFYTTSMLFYQQWWTTIWISMSFYQDWWTSIQFK